jgi:hypothetical protein
LAIRGNGTARTGRLWATTRRSRYRLRRNDSPTPNRVCAVPMWSNRHAR